MRKHISLILAIAMLVSCFAFNVYASEEADYTEAEKFAFSLGVADKATYDSNALVTRAEFAEIIARFCGLKDPNSEYNAWNEEVFGADDKDDPAMGTAVYAFSDIDVSLPQYEAISAVCSHGYMNGVTNTHFLPNYSITLDSVVKVIVCMLGYEPIAQEKGGYPNGYQSVGTTLGIRSGVSAGGNDFVTYGQCLQMLYNALDVGVYNFTSIGSDGLIYERGESFLNKVLELYRVTGVLTDNGVTTLYGNSRVGASAVVVDGVKILTDIAEYHGTDYLGHEVEAYYKVNESGKNELVHISLLGDEAVSFDSHAFAGYQNSKISYEDENGRIVTQSMVSNPTLIYNNKVKSTYTITDFDFPHGEITLLKTGGSSLYDTIVIKDYAVGKVRKVDAEQEIIYIESLYSGTNRTIDVSPSNNKVIKITDDAGNEISADTIRTNSIVSAIVSDDGSYVEAVVSTKMVQNFVITNYERDDFSLTVSNGETDYVFADIQHMSGVPVVNMGDGYDILFDFEGNPVWIEKSSSLTGAKMAFLIEAGMNPNGLNTDYAVKMYTQNGKIEVFSIGEKLMLNNSSRDIANAYTEIQNAEEEIVLYTTNEDGTELKSLVIPLEIGQLDTDNRGWYHISKKVDLSKPEGTSDTDWAADVERDGMKYATRGTSFDKSVHYASGSTKVFSVPGDRSNYDKEKYFSLTNTSFSTSKKQMVNAYSTKSNAMLADVISFSTTTITGQTVSGMEVFLISKISQGLNDEEENVTYLDGYIIDGNSWAVREDKFVFTEDTLFVRGDASSTVIDPTAPGYDINVDGPATLSDLEVGDILRYSVDIDKNLVSAMVAYDCSTGNFFVDASEKQLPFYRGGMNAGYPLYVEGNYVKLSVDDPQTVNMADPVLMSDPTKIMACDVKPATVFVVEDGAKGVRVVRKGSIEDIQTYEDTGALSNLSDYDRVAVPLYWGRTIGTVIYK